MPGKTKAKSIKNPGPAERPETTAIVLRIAADRATDFEAMFEAEELPIWDDFTGRGRFLEARLVRAVGGSEQRRGIQDYLLHIVAADHEAHEEHDRDPRFRAFLAKAERFQPDRRSSGSARQSLNGEVESDDTPGASMLVSRPT